jgi:hypothetical protein
MDDIGESNPVLNRHEPAFITQFCAMHQLWMSSPRSIQLSLPCSSPSWADILPTGEQGSGASPLTLAKLIPDYPGPLQWYPLHPPYPGSEIVMTTLFDYAAATYGKERLLLLVQSLPEHTSWQTLVPAVFGVSANDFEKGWRDDLMARY